MSPRTFDTHWIKPYRIVYLILIVILACLVYFVRCHKETENILPHEIVYIPLDLSTSRFSQGWIFKDKAAIKIITNALELDTNKKPISSRIGIESSVNHVIISFDKEGNVQAVYEVLGNDILVSPERSRYDDAETIEIVEALISWDAATKTTAEQLREIKKAAGW